MKSVLIFIFLTSFVILPSLVLADVKTPLEPLSNNDLKALARLVTADQPELKSLVVEMYSRGAQHIYLAYHRKPDDFSLLVCDAVDLTPLYMVAAKTLLFYDPMKPSIQIIHDMGAEFELAFDQHELRFLAMADRKVKDHQILRLDIPSILGRIQHNLASSRLPDGQYIFSGQTDEGSFLQARIDPEAIIPYSRIEITSPGENEPVLVIRRLQANVELDPNVFQLHQERLRSLGLNIEAVSFTFENSSQIMASEFRSFLFREALRNSDQRQDMVQLGIQASDWVEIRRRDKEIAPKLRKVFQIQKLIRSKSFPLKGKD